MARSFAPALAALSLIVAGCASRAPEPVARVPLAQPTPMPMPLPPPGAAAGLDLPQRLADGGFATLNRGLSPAGSVWHLRAALNVAALGCDDARGGVSAGYNQLLKTQKAALATAHKALAREYPSQAEFDAAMTRLYHYFSQPPAQPGFCAAARGVIAEAAALPAGAISNYAPAALDRLERPFTEFYVAYARYRADLASWRATGRWQPLLTVDPAVLLASEEVTGGERPVRYAARASARTAR